MGYTFHGRFSDVWHCVISDQLRALYLGDNDFETFPPEVGRLKNLQIVRRTITLWKQAYAIYRDFFQL